eukprot:7144336-Pyramimonas_sp.AAC.1
MHIRPVSPSFSVLRDSSVAFWLNLGYQVSASGYQDMILSLCSSTHTTMNIRLLLAAGCEPRRTQSYQTARGANWTIVEFSSMRVRQRLYSSAVSA